MTAIDHMLPLLLLSSFSLVLGLQEGFISIDCGAENNSGDEKTGLIYTPDSPYIDTGENRKIPENLGESATNLQLRNLRSFSEGKRNCYTLKPVTKGSKYIVRAFFLHGNYDGEKELPTFLLYVGTNLWSVVQVTNASQTYWYEICVLATGNTISMCLLDIDKWRPFISALELRPANPNTVSIAYFSSALFSMATVARINFGASDDSYIRYPTDCRDLIWIPFNAPGWSQLSTDTTFSVQENTPLQVMQTSVFPKTGSSIDFTWPVDLRNGTSYYYLVFHYADLLPSNTNGSRIFNISVNGVDLFSNIATSYLTCDYKWTTSAVVLQQWHYSVYKADGSTLPPIINAMEVFEVYILTENATDAGDVDAIMEIKAAYKIRRNWMGDPCTLLEFVWDGVHCSYGGNPYRIVALNLSSSGLTGEIPSSLFNLTELHTLDLSWNNLTGVIPNFFGMLPKLQTININCSGLSGPTIYNLKFSEMCPLFPQSNDEDLTKNSDESKSKMIALRIGVPVGLAAICAVLMGLLFTRWNRKNHSAPPMGPKNKDALHNMQFSPQFSQSFCKEFSVLELSRMTNNYEVVIGRGGFGEVYHGILEGSTPVAIKKLSGLSPNGFKQFQAEINVLKTVHHRNLVGFVGYCKEENNLALVYEYMAQGSLADHLSGNCGAPNILYWGRRIQIAREASQGLEYLHVGCQHHIVHRDVKASNILLNENMEAKIADFGLSKVFSRHGVLHASTTIMGTPGYLDPEYSNTGILTEKSDVYSFGIVLLELISGLPCFNQEAERVHIVERVKDLLNNGDLQGIIDKKLLGAYEVNSAWKAIDIAMACTASTSVDRPTMSEVVAQLKDCVASAIHDSNRNVDGDTMLPRSSNRDADSMSIPLAR